MRKPFHHHLKHAFIPHKGNDHRPHALRSRSLKVYSAVILSVKLLAAILVAVYPGASYVSNITSQNIVSLTNQARTAAGLSSLSTNGLLAQAAQAKANDMISNSYFAHTSPANRTPWDWFNRAGYSYKYAGENLAKDFSTAEEVVNAWLNSPLHKKNIMNGNYRDIGVAVATGESNGVTTIVIAQMFGTPLQSAFASTEPSTDRPRPDTPEPQPTPEPAPPSQPPLRPVLVLPKTESLVNDAAPVIAGRTTPNAQVLVKELETIIGSTTADQVGDFSLRPAKPLTEGAHSVLAYASGPDSDLTSEPSAQIAFIIDTTAPIIQRDATVIIPAWEPRSAYLVIAEVVNDPVSVDVRLAGQTVGLAFGPLGYYGTIDTLNSSQPNQSIILAATDEADNHINEPILSTDYFSVDVLQPSRVLSPESLLKLLLYSRNFFLAFLIFLALALSLQVFVRVRVQHHASVVSTLLLMYTIVVILII